jgi:integrase
MTAQTPYSPSFGTPHQWNAVAATHRSWVALTMNSGGPYKRSTVESVTARLMIWCYEQGLNVDADEMLDTATIGRFITVGLPGRTSGTRANYRTVLYSVRRAVLGVDSPPDERIAVENAVPPYSDEDLRELVRWSLGRSTPNMRINLSTLIALGAGCGLRAEEINPLRVEQLRFITNGAVVVQVEGRYPRIVVCRAEWERNLEHLADVAPAKLAFRPERSGQSTNAINGFINNAGSTHSNLKLSVQRLRATWIVRHIEARTPLTALIDAAGVKGFDALARYLKYVRGPSADDASRLLRGEPLDHPSQHTGTSRCITHRRIS